MKVVIIEDEFFSAEKLKSQLLLIDPHIDIQAILPSVEEGKKWFRQHEEPDLIFSDIELEDQQSFELFNALQIETPIVYTTAYNQYALQAFKQNSIDYLLKPIEIEALRLALKKYENLEYRALKRGLKYQILPKAEGNKERFVVKKGNHMAIVKLAEIAYFKSDQKLTFLITYDQQKYIIEQTLDQLGEELDSRKFYRISRSRLVALDSILKIHSHFNGRLKLDLNPADEEEVFVSRERVQNFRDWLEG